MAVEQLTLWDTDPAHAARDKVIQVHERLCATYQCPVEYFSGSDPLSMLISSLLSHRTLNAHTGRAMAALRERYAGWVALRDAPVEEVEAAIAPVTWPELKAPRLQAVLREITARRGELSLGFLEELPTEEARAWLESIPGVGPKTSASVMGYSTLRRKALVVDSHHHRVAVRLGLVSARAPLGVASARLEAQLPPEWDAQKVYDHHQVMMRHGKKCCYPRPREPACGRCPVLELCPAGRARRKRGEA